ncbi:MAG: MMPL family transporter [Myxococcota bacterium]|nr:MMPL family transporter [Myxococcota bacterium]
MADEKHPQSQMEDSLPESAISMRFARFIMRNRFGTLMTLLSIGFFFFLPLLNVPLEMLGTPLPGVRTFGMDTRARDQWPEHPFIHTSDKFTGRFGTASFVAISVVKTDGEVYDSDFLEKVKRITDAVDVAPNVNHYQVSSLSHINTRVIRIEPDGSLTAEMLMEEVPEDEDELAAFKALVLQNPLLIYGRLISRDHTAALIQAGFITHRLDNREAYQALFDHMMKIKADEEADGTAKVYISGFPMVVGWTYIHVFEILYFLLATIVLLFFLLLAYFRRLHGVAIPMVAGLSTAIWGLGFTAWVGIALDPLILVIPLLITARSISHTIQMAERFFEDYEMEIDARGRSAGRDLNADEITDAKVETATTAMAKLMLPGMLGIITDAAGLMVIFITTIQLMRNLALFGSFWVLAIFFNVILLHPIMIAYLPPPHDTKHYTPRFMNWILGWAGRLTTGPAKHAVVGVAMVFLVIATWFVLNFSTIGESRPGAPIFWPDHPFNVATAQIAEKFGGVDQFTVFIDGDQKGASANGAVLQRMEAMERHMKKYADPGASVSLVNFIRVFWDVNHYGDPKWGFVPDSASAIKRIVFQLVSNSTPGALRPYLTDEQEDSNITFFFPDHKGETIRKAVHYAEEFIENNPMGRVSTRLREDRGGALDVAYYMLGPLLFAREKNMEVFIAQIDEVQEIQGYDQAEPYPVGEWTEPVDRAEVEKNVIDALVKLGNVRRDKITPTSHLFDDLNIKKDRIDKIARLLSAKFDYRIERLNKTAKQVALDPYGPWTSVDRIVEDIVDRSVYYVVEEWHDEGLAITAQTIRYCPAYWGYCEYELWVKNDKFKDSSFNPQPTGSWTRGSEFAMAGGLMGILGAVNEEVERGHVANILLIFLIVFTFVGVSYRSATAGIVIVVSLATGTLLSLFYMAMRNTGLNVNTLPVQSVGVGIGVDYSIYITDRIRQEYSWCGDLDEGIRRAIRTTGMAVTFTATTLVGGIGAWIFSELRFQAEMAQLLVILMVMNMLGAILLVPAWFSILRPSFFAASLGQEAEKPGVEAEPPLASRTA